MEKLCPDLDSPQNTVNLIYRTSHLDNIKFPTAGCSGVFCVLQPIRKGTDIGLPDLESTQKWASGDIYIIHIGNVLYTPEIAPIVPL